MPRRKGHSLIGIDLQPKSAKMVQLHFGSQGISLAGHSSVSFEESLTPLVDHKPHKVVDALKAAIKSGGLSGSRAVITLPPNKVDVRTLTLGGSDVDLDKMLNWEAESYLHYDVADASIDYVELGRVKVGKEERSDVLVAAARKAYIHELLELMAGAGLMVTAVDIVPMALWRLGSHVGRELNAPFSLIDIGRTASVAVILNRGDLRLTRTIDRGGDEFTTRIMDSLEVSHDEAELLKKEYGTGVPGHGAHLDSENELVTKTEIEGTVHEILRRDLEELAGELQKLFRYFSTLNKGVPVRCGYLCGGGGLLKGLDAFLAERAGIGIERLPSLEAVFSTQSGEASEEVGPEYAVAAGLALRRIDADQ